MSKLRAKVVRNAIPQVNMSAKHYAVDSGMAGPDPGRGSAFSDPFGEYPIRFSKQSPFPNPDRVISGISGAGALDFKWEVTVRIFSPASSGPTYSISRILSATKLFTFVT